MTTTYQLSDFTVSNSSMIVNDGVDRMYKESVLVYLMRYPMIYLKGLGTERKCSQKNRPRRSEPNLWLHASEATISASIGDGLHT
jgi:hypothetical protein